MRQRNKFAAAPTKSQKPEPLAAIMKIGLLIHEDGLIWLFHDKPFPHELEWLEYDGDDNSITLIGTGGIAMELGLPPLKSQIEILLHCEYMMTAHIENDDVQDMKLVSVVSRKIGRDDENITPRSKEVG